MELDLVMDFSIKGISEELEYLIIDYLLMIRL